MEHICLIQTTEFRLLANDDTVDGKYLRDSSAVQTRVLDLVSK